MKILKVNKALILGTVLIMTLGCVAQPPNPPAKTPKMMGQLETSIERNPIGTATALMLSLGAAALGYKIRKNGRENSEK